jgi:hypothetical protein
MMMDLIPKELRDKWAPVVGNFIIEFGHVEIAISEALRMSTSPAQFDVLVKLGYSQRAKLAKAALIEWNPNEEAVIVEEFKTLDEIAKRRNIVAHNGFSLLISEAKDGDGMFYEFGMTPTYKASDVFLQIRDLVLDTEELLKVHEKIISYIPRKAFT